MVALDWNSRTGFTLHYLKETERDSQVKKITFYHVIQTYFYIYVSFNKKIKSLKIEFLGFFNFEKKAPFSNQTAFGGQIKVNLDSNESTPGFKWCSVNWPLVNSYLKLGALSFEFHNHFELTKGPYFRSKKKKYT